MEFTSAFLENENAATAADNFLSIVGSFELAAELEVTAAADAFTLEKHPCLNWSNNAFNHLSYRGSFGELEMRRFRVPELPFLVLVPAV